MNLTRRKFVQNSALSLAALRLGKAFGEAAQLPIGFSTLGCPAWDWAKILEFAQQNGFAAVELRGLRGQMDLPSLPEFAPDHIPQLKKDVAAHGLRISCLGSSANMHDTDSAKHEQQLADARRFIDLASALAAPYVRVFGNKLIGDRNLAIQHLAQSLRTLGDYAAPKKVTVLIESHGDFTDSPTLKAILEQAASPHVALLWDAHHTFVSGKEEPEFTVKQLGQYIRHTHLKDSVRKGDDVQYVLTGRGQVPVKRQVEALVSIGYQGYFSFEWEKAWHPELAEPEVAFPDYARVMAGYLKSAGVVKY
jgi:sugar phosphate isomerase/epimerase